MCRHRHHSVPYRWGRHDTMSLTGSRSHVAEHREMLSSVGRARHNSAHS